MKRKKKKVGRPRPAVAMDCRRPLFPIVGVGASAGGLEAFTQLLGKLPLDTGMGFVLVQHLDPGHDSALTQILSRATRLPVREVTKQQAVKPNHVYVIPPASNLTIADGTLSLQKRAPAGKPNRPIDAFFEALAHDQRECAVGIVLSGTASDGTLGLEAIKAEGGITFAQDDTAKYSSMPRSAVAAGCVDLVLSPAAIARELALIATHPHGAGQPLRLSQSIEVSPEVGTGNESRGRPEAGRASRAADRADEAYHRILALLRNHSGVDFSLYKPSTIQRRIARRLVLSRQHSLDDYARFLSGNGRELEALYSDVLISVTSFFRNPEAFGLLKRKVLPELLKQRGDEPLRCWVLGCSAGQEAYSIAMTFAETTEKLPRARRLQIFATDLNEVLLDKARNGLYAKSVVAEISPQRLRRFFIEESGGYRISKELRDMVVFARQNLIADPPFSRLDLISCRNLLIYLEPRLQQKALPTFHYALRPGGYLMLGTSESIGAYTDLFEAVDKKLRIYVRKSVPTTAFHLPEKRAPGRETGAIRPSASARKTGRTIPPEAGRDALTAQREADRITVNKYAPPSVLVNDALQVLQFRGPTDAYLQPPSGKASFDVLKMAREGLMLPLRTAIRLARKQGRSVRKRDVRIRQKGASRSVNLEVIPLRNLRERGFLILFTEGSMPGRSAGRVVTAPDSESTRVPVGQQARRIAELESELAETRDYLQSMQEQHEASNEELQAANEEVQSANEELQSVNEELETSKEELESANEELITLNEELSNRNIELNRLNNDLVNVENAALFAVVLVGRDLGVRRFSPQAEQLLELMVGDLGRPIGVVRHGLRMMGPEGAEAPLKLENVCAEVIDSLREQALEVLDRTGKWHSLNARPYLTLDNKVDGAVLVLADIDSLKSSEQEIIGKESALQQTNAQLVEHSEELTRFNRLAVGRELRMIDLKKEVNMLLEQLGHATKYPLEFESDAAADRSGQSDPE